MKVNEIIGFFYGISPGCLESLRLGSTRTPSARCTGAIEDVFARVQKKRLRLAAQKTSRAGIFGRL